MAKFNIEEVDQEVISHGIDRESLGAVEINSACNESFIHLSVENYGNNPRESIWIGSSISLNEAEQLANHLLLIVKQKRQSQNLTT